MKKKFLVCGLVFLIILISAIGAEIYYPDTQVYTNREAEIEQKPITENIQSKETEIIQEEIVEKPKNDSVETNYVSAEEDLTCTFCIRCDTILSNLDKLSKNKTEIIPTDGIILFPHETVFYEGESVFNVLLRETKQNNIHFEFQMSPMYETAYIEGIANIYEFDCGDLSGWMYKVNGTIPDVGCSSYEVKNGDVIEFLYTCNLGKDLR